MTYTEAVEELDKLQATFRELKYDEAFVKRKNLFVAPVSAKYQKEYIYNLYNGLDLVFIENTKAHIDNWDIFGHYYDESNEMIITYEFTKDANTFG